MQHGARPGAAAAPDNIDQRVQESIKDMTGGKPMDRLICGDVGFGKTEVALRAAFVAVAGGKQVAILCPTTLLAEQHFHTFQDRFALIENDSRIRQAVRGIKAMFRADGLIQPGKARKAE
mgnify:CR=1 FL=1